MIAEERKETMKDTLYICTETDELFTLGKLENEFNSYGEETMTFEEFMDAATDMSGSLREIQSVRHYLYYINYSIETETNYITVSLDTASADGQLF